MGQAKPPETNALRYRKRAADLRAMAEKATDSDVKRELHLMARQYDKLAEDSSRRRRDS